MKQEELQQVREKTKLTMQREVNELEGRLKECSRSIQEKRARIEKLEGWVRGLKSTIPEAIEALKALVAQLPEL
jgi:peptidoglycan hydrolase CwlO-like protein